MISKSTELPCRKLRALSLPKDVSPLYTGNVSDEIVLNFMVDPVVESLGGLDVVSCGKSWEFIQLYKTFTLRPHCLTLLANAGICFGKLILDSKYLPLIAFSAYFANDHL